MANARKQGTTAAEMPTRARYDELKQMLAGRQHDLQSELKGKIRDVRADGSEKLHDVLDEVESSEIDSQEAIEFALIQMKAETLNKINEALSRLEDGTYGHCFECGGEIAEARLRALPFAARCRGCEEAREAADFRERMRQRRGSATSLDA
jgi:DnaK suppressor protein